MINVIIPTYKPLGYLFDCLKSFQQQDLDPSEYMVKIVLNGDKEPYFSQIEEYLSDNSFENCEILYSEHKGVSYARNYGLDSIIEKDGYVVFVDDDDKVSTNFLSGLLDVIENDTSVSLSNERTFFDGSSSEKKGYLAFKFEMLKNSINTNSIISYRSFLSTACFKMIPMNVIGSRRFNPNFKNGEDALFMASISCNINEIYLADESVIYYRRIRENSASQRKRSFISKLVNSIKLLLAYMKIYVTSPFKYNFLFFLNRFVAVFKVLFVKEF